DEVLQRRRGGSRRALAPERVDQTIGRDDMARIEQQESEDGALLPAAQLKLLAVTPRPPSRGSESPACAVCSTFLAEPVSAPLAASKGPMSAPSDPRRNERP